MTVSTLGVVSLSIRHYTFIGLDKGCKGRPNALNEFCLGWCKYPEGIRQRINDGRGPC